MLSVVLTILVSYLVTTLFGHVVHWSLHQPWTGWLNNAHMTHHQRLYPPYDYLSDVYRQAGKDSTPKFFAIAAIPLIVAPPILWAVGALPLPMMITILVMELVIGFLHNYLHDAFHIRKHWLYRVPVIKSWFGNWVNLHWQHHIDMQSNFGIFSFFWDRVFSTYVDIKKK
jgi:sterol desaturase/sphingolipid hydroxylase (fatty acid hydroxylase superfamily)